MKEEKHWILLSKKVAGEATPEELEQLRDLLNADPEWKAALENLQELWVSAPIAVEDGQAGNEEAYRKHINRLKLYVSDFSEIEGIVEAESSSFSRKVKKLFYTRWFTYAALASFIVSVIAVYIFGAGNSNSEEKPADANSVNEIAISPGSKSKIQLPDGSQVWINSGSKLTYSGMMKGNTREVTLDGEAYFDIVKDPAHPFIVHTSGIDIKVLGTAFNVKAYKIEPTIEATLIHGSIEVTNRNKPDAPTIMLKPREKLVFSNNIQMPETNSTKAMPLFGVSTEKHPSIFITPLKRNIADSLIVETAWIYNRLPFEDKPFEELALDMERWYNVKFIFKNKRVAAVHLTGSFTTETIEQALEALRFLVNFKYSITDGIILIE